MTQLVPNIAKGRANYYATLPATNDALIWTILTGTETDDNIRDADHLTAVIALAVNEATFTGFARVTATGVTVTIDDTNNRQSFDVADPSWSPTSAEAVTRILLGYDPDTTGGTDSDIVPVFVDDMPLTTATSGTLTYNVASGTPVGPFSAS